MGTFTVPSGGDEFWYIAAYFLMFYSEYAWFDIQLNGATLCTVQTDQEDPLEYGQAACSASALTAEDVENDISGFYVKTIYIIVASFINR